MSDQKSEELLSFLTDVVGMDEEEIEEQAEQMVEDDVVLVKANAYQKIKDENVAQPQETVDVEGAYLGTQTRTNSDDEITGYVTWVFSETENEVVRVNSDETLVDDSVRPFSDISIEEVEEWENLETEYEWMKVSDDSATSVDSDTLRHDLVLDYAQTVGEVDEDRVYLVIADAADVDTLGEFHEDTGDYLGRKPVIEDEDTANLRLMLEEPRTGGQATIKLKDPRNVIDIVGGDFDLQRLMKISAQSDAQEMAQQLFTVLDGETVIIFGRGSAYVNEEEITDDDGNRRPWLTLSGFDPGFITSLDELEAQE
jgi:hypothetical protein